MNKSVAFAVGACAGLALYNNLVGVLPWHRRWYPAVNAVAAAGVVAAALGSGLSPGELGLGRDRVRDGLWLGVAAAGPVVVFFGAASLVPLGRRLLNDQRVAGLSRGELVYQGLVRIPVGTVAWEEVAFRGVLRASLRRVLEEPWATAVEASVFGVWHIRPTIEALSVNGVAAGRGTRVAVAAVTVGMAGAGVVLSLLRERSGSLAAPVLLHLATNCTGPLVSAALSPVMKLRFERVLTCLKCGFIRARASVGRWLPRWASC